MEYKDKLGTPLQVGMFFTYAVAQYHSARIRIGVITELTEREHRYNNGTRSAVKARVIAEFYTDSNTPLRVNNRTLDPEDLIVASSFPERYAKLLLSTDKVESNPPTDKLDIHNI
jgi:hypothetical protein